MDRTRRNWRNREPTRNHSISSDRIHRNYSDCRWLSAVVVHTDLPLWSNRQATERSELSRAWNNWCRQTPAVRTRNLPEFRCCNCPTTAPRRYAKVPKPIHRIRDTLAEVVVEEGAAENSSPLSASGIQDLPLEHQRAHSTNTAYRCSCFQSDAMPRTGNNMCSPCRIRRWARLWPADRLWWIHRNTGSVGHLRKCNRFWWFHRLMRHRIPVRHRHTGCRSLWIEPSRSSTSHSRSRHTNRNMERGSWLSMWMSL